MQCLRCRPARWIDAGPTPAWGGLTGSRDRSTFGPWSCSSARGRWRRLPRRAAAGARAEGRVVFVTGEPGIGKTSLVTRFASRSRRRARACSSAPATTSRSRVRSGRSVTSSEPSRPTLETALRAGAPPHEMQALLLAELERPPRPTVLVLEDVHWADEATLDSITVLGRRIALASGAARPDLPRRRGAARPPAARGARRDPCRRRGCDRARTALRSEAVAALAGRRRRRRLRRHRRQPVLRHRAARLGNDRRAAAVGRERGPRSRRAARRRRAPARRARLGRPAPRAARRCSTPCMPGWPLAAVEPERRQLLEVDPTHVRFRHELARNAISSSLPIAARRRLHGEILEALLGGRGRPGRDRPPRRGSRRRRRRRRLRAGRGPARRGARLEPRGVLALPAGRGLRRPALGRRAGVHARGARLRRLRRRPGSTTRSPRSSARSRSTPSSATTEARRPVHARPLAAALVRRRRRRRARRPRSRRSRSSSRSASRSSSPAPTAGSPSSRCSPRIREEALEWGDKALELATRLGDEEHPRPRARQHRRRAGPARSPDDTATLLEAHAVADAAGDRHEATRALINLAYTLMLLGAARAGAAYARARRSRTPRSTRCTRFASYAATMLAWLRLRAGDWDEAESVTQARARAGRHRPPAAREDRARRARRPPRRSGRRRAARRPRRAGRPRGRAAAHGAGGRARGRVGADGRRADADRAHPERSLEDVQAAGPARRLGLAAPRGLGRGGGHRARRRRAGLGAHAAMLARDWRAAADALRRRRVAVRPRADAVAARRRGGARRGDRDRARARGRAADAPRGPSACATLGLRVPAGRARRRARTPRGSPPGSSRCSRSSCAG